MSDTKERCCSGILGRSNTETKLWYYSTHEATITEVVFLRISDKLLYIHGL